jgi:hypothetical protein
MAAPAMSSLPAESGLWCPGVPGLGRAAESRLAQLAPGHVGQFPDRMDSGGAAALRAHRSYLAMAHRSIVRSWQARREDMQKSAIRQKL